MKCVTKLVKTFFLTFLVFFLILALKIINKIQLDLKIIHFSQKITKTKICCHGNHDNV